MNWNTKHTVQSESILNRKCLYCISLQHGERLLTIIRQVYDYADDAKDKNVKQIDAVYIPYHDWPLSPEQQAIDQEIVDTLFTAITRSQERHADVISSWLTFRQLQRCANLLWDLHAVIVYPDDVKEQDTLIYKALVNCMMSLEYEDSHREDGGQNG
jgi:hypothetical protein